MSDQTLIYAYVSDPSNSMFKSNRNDKAKCTVIHCDNTANCDLFKRGECLRLKMAESRCPYGRKNTETGFTKKAAGYHKWRRDRQEKYKDVLSTLKSPSDMLARIGDYVYLPYAHMNMCENVPFGNHGGFMRNGDNYLHIDSFTPEIISKIIWNHPQALFGGEITSYQKESVPRFVAHLRERMPELFKSVCEFDSHIAARFSKPISAIGRKALLSSLRPGVVITKYHDSSNLKTQHWTWDGTNLVSTDTSLSFAVVEYDEITITITPKPGVAVEITDNDQVDENTVFTT